MKSSVADIRARFDHDVDRFSDADSGQTTTMDAGIVLDMITRSMALAAPGAQSMLDIGCGAGNFCIRSLRILPGLRCSLVDLSAPMLERAQSRILAAGGGIGQIWQDDIRKVELPAASYDLISAAAVLHHLRSRSEWHQTMAKICQALKPGGSFWFWDLVKHESAALGSVQHQRWAAYLDESGGPGHHRKVFEYVEAEDSPESVSFIMQAMLGAGFSCVDVIHKNGPFVAMLASVKGHGIQESVHE